MDQILMAKMIEAMSEGDTRKLIGYGLIFIVLWLEVRGLKNQLKNLNDTIAKSFAAGERRFKTIEKDIHQIRLDVDELKHKITQGGKNGNYQQTDFARSPG